MENGKTTGRKQYKKRRGADSHEEDWIVVTVLQTTSLFTVDSSHPPSISSAEKLVLHAGKCRFGLWLPPWKAREQNPKRFSSSCMVRDLVSKRMMANALVQQ